MITALLNRITQSQAEIIRDELKMQLSLLHDRPRGCIDDALREAISRSAGLKWDTGTEQFDNLFEDQLLELFGALDIYDEKLCFLAPRIDIDNRADPWDTKAYTEVHGESLHLKHHQLTAIIKHIDNAFKGKPILLMDTVGLGKTLTIAATWCVLRAFQAWYEEFQDYPGRWSKSFV
jgi:hypothetical protein